MPVHRRTFEAAKHPQGSPERERLNADSITSEYMTSYRYVGVKPHGQRQTFRTRREAEHFAAIGQPNTEQLIGRVRESLRQLHDRTEGGALHTLDLVCDRWDEYEQEMR